jgi:hypothetical protein
MFFFDNACPICLVVLIDISTWRLPLGRFRTPHTSWNSRLSVPWMADAFVTSARFSSEMIGLIIDSSANGSQIQARPMFALLAHTRDGPGRPFKLPVRE